jgi:hypothetical protein
VLLLAGSGLAGCTDDEPAAPDLSSTTSSVGDSDVSCGEGVQALVEGGAAVEFTTTTLTLQPAEGDPVEGCYLVADTIEERSRGLMATTDLGEYAGMVFVFEADANGGFYMKDTLIPLSIAWFTAAGEFVSSADMEPCPDELAAQDECPTYAASGEYRYAIEVPQGDLEAVGIDGLGSSLETG